MPTNPNGSPPVGGAPAVPPIPAGRGTMEGTIPEQGAAGDMAPNGAAGSPSVQVLPGGGTGEVQNPAGRVLRGGGPAATPAMP